MSIDKVKSGWQALALASVLATVAGCSLLSDNRGLVVDRSKEYTEIKEHDPLLVPEGLEPAGTDSSFALPEIINTNGAIFPDRAPRPAPIYADNRSQGVKIQRLGDRRWLVIGERPGVVWPKLKQFLAENGVATSFESADLGRVRTEWLEVGEQRVRDVVRLSIQQGRSESLKEDGAAAVDEAAAALDEAAGPLPEPGDAEAVAKTTDDTAIKSEATADKRDEIVINSGVLASALGVGAGDLNPADVLGQLNDVSGAGADSTPEELALAGAPGAASAEAETEEVVVFVGERERIIFSIEQGMRLSLIHI